MDRRTGRRLAACGRRRFEARGLRVRHGCREPVPERRQDGRRRRDGHDGHAALGRRLERHAPRCHARRGADQAHLCPNRRRRIRADRACDRHVVHRRAAARRGRARYDLVRRFGQDRRGRRRQGRDEDHPRVGRRPAGYEPRADWRRRRAQRYADRCRGRRAHLYLRGAEGADRVFDFGLHRRCRVGQSGRHDAGAVQSLGLHDGLAARQLGDRPDHRRPYDSGRFGQERRDTRRCRLRLQLPRPARQIDRQGG